MIWFAIVYLAGVAWLLCEIERAPVLDWHD